MYSFTLDMHSPPLLPPPPHTHPRAQHTQTQNLREKVSLQENQFKALVDQGNALLESMDPQTDAEQFMDGKLSNLEQRWTDLVSQVRM